MNNGDLDSKGLLASLISGEGTVESFKVSFFQEYTKYFTLLKY